MVYHDLWGGGPAMQLRTELSYNGGYSITILYVVEYLLHVSTSPIALSHVWIHSSLEDRLLTTPCMFDLVRGMGVSFVLDN
jgi:hypothetical protein